MVTVRGQSGSEVVDNAGSGGSGGGELPGGNTVPCPCSYPPDFDPDAAARGFRNLGHGTRDTART
jgi:hypothetical protein